MLESNYQQKIIKKIKSIFNNECEVIKTDERYMQGFPDLLVLAKNKWAALEVKKSANAHRQPNQEYYIDKLDKLSFARFIYPENEEEVLDELQRAFRVNRKTRNSRS